MLDAKQTSLRRYRLWIKMAQTCVLQSTDDAIFQKYVRERDNYVHLYVKLLKSGANYAR